MWPSSKWRSLLLLLPVAACTGSPGETDTEIAAVSCAPFARELTGLPLRGDAASWWAQASGRYARSHLPQVGSVLVFRAEGRLPSGHVSVVSRILGERRIEVIQANWTPGMMERNLRVSDVSVNGDWSLVRVWWVASGALGSHPYQTYGFIVPPAPRGHDALASDARAAALRAARG